jgi:hypothetical protein
MKVTAETKALQCMATLCSCLKYYGQAVIGVVRDADREIIVNAVIKHHHLHFFTFLWKCHFLKLGGVRTLSSSRV